MVRGARSARLALSVLLLGLGGACAKTDAVWRAELENRDPFVRGLAAIGLSLESPRDAQVALPELLQTIDRSHVGLERAAAFVLSRVGRYQVPGLLECLVDGERISSDRRGAIKNALVAAGPAVSEPVVACLRGPGSHLAGDLGDVLLVIGAPAVPHIAQMLTDEDDPRLKKFAAFLLGQLGPVAQAALPALRDAASASDPELRAVAEGAMGQIRANRPEAATRTPRGGR